jgi:flagellar FliL protein
MAQVEPDIITAKPSRKKAYIALGLAAVMGLGFGIYSFGFPQPSDNTPGIETDSTGAVSEDPSSPSSPETNVSTSQKVLLLEDFIVNLQRQERSAQRYARVRIALVYNPTAAAIGSLDEKALFFRSSFHEFLSQLSERDLQGSMALLTLKEELMRRANAVIGDGVVTDVLVTDLVIQ